MLILQVTPIAPVMHAYRIFIDLHVIERDELLVQQIIGPQVLIVSNETVAKHHMENLRVSLERGFQSLGRTTYQIDQHLLPDGEAYKNITELERIFTVLIERKHHRHTTLIALGGGVIGDITGFAAACYQRGVPYIQVPTTLLAQVDAAIGGKTAVNHPLGKNMMGAFHHPRAVFMDINLLSTLPQRELNSGLAEVIKHALINDETFFIWLEKHVSHVQKRDPNILMELVYRSCAIKAAVIQQDPYETANGQRMLLNFGHTVAHALEAALGYGTLLHGEAVAIGMMVEAQFSTSVVNFPMDAVKRLARLLKHFDLPTDIPEQLDIEQLTKFMLTDKKNTSNHLTMVVLTQLGQARVLKSVQVEELQAIFKYRKR